MRYELKILKPKPTNIKKFIKLIAKISYIGMSQIREPRLSAYTMNRSWLTWNGS